MADGFADAAKTVARRTFAWRAWLRAFHRDIGYLAVGLTVVYALSGIAVNHVADWDPNFRNSETIRELGTALPEDDGEATALVLSKLGIQERPRESYREGDQLEILFEHRTLHVSANGRVVEDEQRPRFLLRAANWLHLNRGKKAWTYVADAYAAALLFLACSGMLMVKGRQGLFGRGVIFVVIGVAIPIVYVSLAPR